ncbi:MAG: hypothetical protein MI862_05575 [Desulfobacterales bacterium]|nr:hypothetical protein [Desulfobacterales bacterium]
MELQDYCNAISIEINACQEKLSAIKKIVEADSSGLNANIRPFIEQLDQLIGQLDRKIVKTQLRISQKEILL